MEGIRRSLLAVIVLAGCTCAAYFNSLHGEFVFDDEVTVRGHKSVQDSNYPLLSPRGVTYNSYRGQTQLWHYHSVNISIHALNSVLVYAVTGSNIWAGLFFALHPVQTESVAYITGRAELLAAMFVLFGVYLCQKSRANTATTIIIALTATLTLYPLAMLSKESAVVMPVLMLMMIWAKPSPLSYARWQRWMLVCLIALVGCCAIIWVMQNSVASSKFITTINATLTYMTTQATVLLHYLRLILLPLPAYHSADPVIHPTYTTTIAGVGVALTLLTIIIAAMRKPRYRAIGVGVAWFMVALAPTSTLIPIPDVMAEHRLYLPMVGVAMVFGWVFGRPNIHVDSTPLGFPLTQTRRSCDNNLDGNSDP